MVGEPMSEQDTYLRAKLTDINVAIERLTEMLSRMIEVISKITDVQEVTSELVVAVEANGEKLDEVLSILKSAGAPSVRAAPERGRAATADMGIVSSLQTLLDTLESQVREGVIASDLAKKVGDAADTMEQKIGSGPLVVKMRRWVRILRTYGRVDPVSPADITKLRQEIREWSRELAIKR